MQVRIMCKLGMWGRETIRLTSANDGIRHCGEATLHLLQQVLYLSFPTEATPMIHVVILLGDSGGGGDAAPCGSAVLGRRAGWALVQRWSSPGCFAALHRRPSTHRRALRRRRSPPADGMSTERRAEGPQDGRGADHGGLPNEC